MVNTVLNQRVFASRGKSSLNTISYNFLSDNPFCPCSIVFSNFELFAAAFVFFDCLNVEDR